MGEDIFVFCHFLRCSAIEILFNSSSFSNYFKHNSILIIQEEIDMVNSILLILFGEENSNTKLSAFSFIFKYAISTFFFTICVWFSVGKPMLSQLMKQMSDAALVNITIIFLKTKKIKYKYTKGTIWGMRLSSKGMCLRDSGCLWVLEVLLARLWACGAWSLSHTFDNLT